MSVLNQSALFKNWEKLEGKFNGGKEKFRKKRNSYHRNLF
jgi:hypothetical protein